MPGKFQGSKSVRALKCAHSVYAFVGRHESIPKTKNALQVIRERLLLEDGWRPAAELLGHWRLEAGDEEGGWPARPSFRATAVRRSTGEKHEFGSMEAAAVAGFAAGKVLGWEVSMQKFNAELVIWVISIQTSNSCECMHLVYLASS